MRERTTTVSDIYAYPETAWSTIDMDGFAIEATDGEIGTVDDATNEIGSGFIVVDTGPWILGKKVMLPAGVITRVDEDDRRAWVHLTKDEIKNAPEFDDSTFGDRGYRDELGAYYTDRLGDTVNRPAGPDYGAGDRVV